MDQGGTTPIAEVTDGDVVTLSGKVEGLGELLRAPLSGEPCLIYEVYDGLEALPKLRGAIDLLLRDDTGEAEIRTEHCEATLLGRVRREQVAAIEANIDEVSRHLADLKARARKVQGPQARALHAEMRSYKRVATLLCAMKAAARGRTHAGMSEREQASFIARERASLASGEAGKFAVALERVETLLLPGQEVRVTGLARFEAAGSRGYRQAGKRLTLSGDPERPVSLEIVGEAVGSAKPRGAKRGDGQAVLAGPEAPAVIAPSRKRTRGGRPKPTPVSWVWLGLAALLGALSYLLLR
ncbi:MAG: hypothetical protein KC731_34115 [Myxococcales bacterium]|nr:hypothetical protein [Myxococcales bacterium]